MPLSIIRQDIVKMQVDAIVNTTNCLMHGFSGVDLAIHTAAGDGLDRECSALSLIPEGEAVITKGYKLGCKYIIHTVGPRWQGGNANEKEQLEGCYRACLNAAVNNGCETVAFPLISSGEYGYPKDLVLKLAVNIITEFLFTHEITVFLCVFDSESYEFSRKLFFDINDYIDDVYVQKQGDLHFRSSRSVYEIPQSSVSSDLKNILPKRAAKPVKKEAVKDYTAESSFCDETLEERIKKLDNSFAETLFCLIDKKNISDIECYKRANVSRKTFSKIKCDPLYKPSKQTAVAFAVALELTLDETEAFLKTAGLSLSHSYKFDVIIEYFVIHKNYNIFEINEALFEFDQPMLGC